MGDKIKNKAIMDMIKEVSPVQPPDDFADRVMARIGLRPVRYGTVNRIRNFLVRPRDLKGFRLFPESITKSQCGFYFILVSLFYLVVGIVFSRSLETISSASYQAIWLLYQPEFSFAIAIGFALLGISFVSGRPVSVRSAKFGIFLYVGVIIINSVILQIDLRIPIVTFALLPLTIGSIIIGGFLTYTMERYSCNVG
ncbi:MAG: hypothetical protein JRC90_01570 [Deltaproteobacteria bacterium]|nr:hypothetical protein [Deltaproteobacteria bacterium]